MPVLGEIEHKGVYRWWISLMETGMRSSGHFELGSPDGHPESSLLGHLPRLTPTKGTPRTASAGLARSARGWSPQVFFVSFLGFPLWTLLRTRGSLAGTRTSIDSGPFRGKRELMFQLALCFFISPNLTLVSTCRQQSRHSAGEQAGSGRSSHLPTAIG